MDAQGYVRITGRINDLLIIRGGENVHPLEIENCLLAHPHVLEISVVGVSDALYGELVAAFVVPQKGKEEALGIKEVRDWVRERLSRHLVPKFVFFVDDYPKTASGKIQKFVLKKMAEQWVREGKGLEEGDAVRK
jgi:acyl-coenzyme A synthetase/AMP-(fatty) acid ligase